jgi:arginyl-tRNA synthetase
MNGSDGKPYKTRDGGVMRLSDLLDIIINAAFDKLNSSDIARESDQKEIARKIGIAAIKFGDLINHRSKDYIFDIDKFLSFEGKTGTYLLYTVTRINSILKKVNVEGSGANFFDIYTDTERNLILTIILSGEAFSHAINERAPNYICDNAYQLANAFSAFYHDNYIVSETDEAKKSTWIALCVITRKLLLKHLDILGIEDVESM